MPMGMGMGTLIYLTTVAYAMSACGNRGSTIVSFNTGLTPTIDHYDARLNATLEQLATVDADVICLQEVWFSDDVAAIVANTMEVFPYSFSAVHSQERRVNNTPVPDCTEASFTTTFLPCIEIVCDIGLGLPAFLTCANTKCSMQDLPQQCISCLLFAGTQILEKCVYSGTNQVNIPGLLLLSKTPLEESTLIDFIPDIKQLLPRSYIKARVGGLGTVACTHLTTNASDVYFEPFLQTVYKSSAEQNKDEVVKILKGFGNGEAVILVGDLNTGPEINGSFACFQETYTYLTDNGLTSPFVDEVGLCTYCETNPFVHSYGYILDHVILKGYTADCIKRILDKKIKNRDYPLSDHYGISMNVYVESHSARVLFNCWSMTFILSSVAILFHSQH